MHLGRASKKNPHRRPAQTGVAKPGEREGRETENGEGGTGKRGMGNGKTGMGAKIAQFFIVIIYILPHVANSLLSQKERERHSAAHEHKRGGRRQVPDPERFVVRPGQRGLPAV